MNSLMTYSKVKKFVDNKALIFIAFLFVLFCSFFTLAYFVSFIQLD